MPQTRTVERIWTDKFIETTFMHYEHGPGGLIGLTLNEKLSIYGQ